MKRILLLVALAITTMTFAQEEEIKILKKLDKKSGQPTQKDIEKLSSALTVLDDNVATLNDDEKVLYHYFKVSQPIMEVMMVAMKDPNDVQAIQKASEKYNSPDFLESMSSHYNTMVDLEKKLGKKEHTEDIKPLMDMMKQQLSKAAFKLNDEKKFKEASEAFYAMYKFDKANGSNLENAAILAVQAEDYMLAEKMYDELKDSDYLNNGVKYYAINKASGQEESFSTRNDMVKMISLGSHEKPRKEKVSKKKPEIYKMLALIAAQNQNYDKAKSAIDGALELSPTNDEYKKEGARIYLNFGYQLLKEDGKLVDEINSNLDNTEKVEGLIEKRKSIFNKALPNFEKAYLLNPNDANIKSMLRSSYKVLEMEDKEATIK